jgi:hypothetical protein
MTGRQLENTYIMPLSIPCSLTLELLGVSLAQAGGAYTVFGGTGLLKAIQGANVERETTRLFG